MPMFPDYARILLAGFKEEPDFGVLRTDMDGGLAKQRPQWTVAIVKRDATIQVGTVALKNDFDQWMEEELNRGVAWFDWRDPLDSKVKQARIVAGKISWTSPGRVWRGAVQLETVG